MAIEPVNVQSAKINSQKSAVSSDITSEKASEHKSSDRNDTKLAVAGVALAAIVIGGIMFHKNYKIKEAERILKESLNREKNFARREFQNVYNSAVYDAQLKRDILINDIRMRGILDRSYDAAKNIERCNRDYNTWLNNLNKLREEYLNKQNEIYETYLRDKKSKESLREALKDIENQFKKETKYKAPSDYGSRYTPHSSGSYSSGSTGGGSSSTGGTHSSGSAGGSSSSTGGTRSSGSTGGGSTSTGGTRSSGSTSGGSTSTGGTRSSGGTGGGSTSTGGTSSSGGTSGGSTSTGGTRSSGSTGGGSTSGASASTGFTSRDYASRTGFTEEQWNKLSGKYSSLNNSLYARFLGLSEQDIILLSRGKKNSDAKRLYRELCLKWHPDKHTECAPDSIEFKIIEQKFSLINTIHNR